MAAAHRIAALQRHLQHVSLDDRENVTVANDTAAPPSSIRSVEALLPRLMKCRIHPPFEKYFRIACFYF